MRIGMLGPLLIDVGGSEAVVPGVLPRVLLIRLALEPGRVVTTGSLVSALWAERMPEDPGHALQALVSRLRRVLPDSAVVRSASGGYSLDIPPDSVDAVRFERLVADGRALLRSGEPGAASRRLGEALSLWRGEPLSDASRAPFAEPVIVRLNEMRLTATEDRIAADLELGLDPASVAAELEELAAAHPMRERLRVLMVKALHSGGRQPEALTAYETYRERLARELGTDPGPELRQAHLAVLRDEPSVRRPAGNLRTPLSSFVGREHERTRVIALTGTHRLVTLAGVGGAGKTRLAVEVADATDYPGGAWLVELAPVTDPAWACITALGLRDTEAAGRNATDRLAEALSAAETLIVLDNCEHLLGAVASLAEELLGRCPGLRVLATSREPLGLTGEALYRVPPLALPGPDILPKAAMEFSAVRLFAERAAAAGVTCTAEDAATMAEICRRLDGLPLAIELAAARLRTLPLAELAARLDDRFTVLTTGGRTAPERHRTLHAVIAWSWDLLDLDERAFAEGLAVFPGGITVGSARAVSGGKPVLDLLASLTDKSLLQLEPGAGARYRMLETIREFGLARLAESGSVSAVRAAHAEWFAGLAETASPHLRSARQLPWLARIEAEQANLWAALRAFRDGGDVASACRLAAVMGMFRLIRGEHAEAVAELEPFLDDPAVVTLWAINAVLSGTPGRAERAEALSTELPAGDHPLLVPALALAADDPGGIEAASRSLEHPDQWIRAMSRLIRALLAANHGDAERSERELAAAVETFREAGERWGLATALTYHAYLGLEAGEFAIAATELEEGVRLLRELGAEPVMQESWLAEAFWRMGETERARAILLGIAEPGTRAGHVFHARKLLGDMARWQGDLLEATRQYGVAADDLGKMPPGTMWTAGFDAMLRAATALLAIRAGDLETARRRAAEAFELAEPETDIVLMAMVAVAIAALRLAEGEPAEAARVLGAAHGLRGAPDEFHPDVMKLSKELATALGESTARRVYGEGSGLERAAALSLIRHACGRRVRPAERTAPAGPPTTRP